MLNKFGGVEADVTVAKVHDGLHTSVIDRAGLQASDDGDLFYIVCDTPHTTFVEHHIRRVAEDEKFDVQLSDLTDQLGILRLEGCSS